MKNLWIIVPICHVSIPDSAHAYPPQQIIIQVDCLRQPLESNFISWCICRIYNGSQSTSNLLVPRLYLKLLENPSLLPGSRLWRPAWLNENQSKAAIYQFLYHIMIRYVGKTEDEPGQVLFSNLCWHLCLEQMSAALWS
jgi:hypothetical protein